MEKLLVSAAAGLSAYGAYALADDHLQLTHDLAMARSLLRGKKALANVPRLSASAAKAADINVCDLWYDALHKYGARESLVSADTGVRLTYADVERLSNRVAHWASGPGGFVPGDTVALFMENRPEFIACWLGLAKIGVTSAWINFNIKSKSLLHCISIAAVKAVIFGSELALHISGISDDLAAAGVTMLALGDLTSHPRVPEKRTNAAENNSIDRDLAAASTATPKDYFAAYRRALHPSSVPFCYIYTSGTTGLPKAVNISHAKFCSPTKIAHAYLRPGVDRNYCVLPLFHSAGGMIGAGMMLCGITLIMRKKFSARNFFSRS